MESKSTTSCWKNEPYFWMLVLIPFSAVVMGFIMLSLAISTASGLVVDDYYKKGKEINLVLARDEAASNMGLSAKLEINPQQQSISVRLTSLTGTILPENITIHFLHATRQGFDQIITLPRSEGNTYRGLVPILPPGRWNLQLSTAHWRLLGSYRVPATVRSIALLPGNQ